ncbi:MAG TPA: D-alanyl-D-alanine carboxypeptidase family protein [Actinomycetales bacterium]|nr:D-alanyl-D-alanine carboxypeptidase family protein [Actinomycetales bacterium]
MSSAPTTQPQPALARLRGGVLVVIVLLAATLALVAPASATAQGAVTGADEDPLAGPGLVVPAGAPAPPQIPAGAWLIADLDSGEVLAANNATAQLAPASTLKILTAVALGPGLDRSKQYTAVHEDAAIDGSKVGLDPGSVYTVDDLLHALMLGSGNDAAFALGNLSGGQNEAVAKMRAEAERIGAASTVVRNTSGLDEPGQVSTARDLALMARALLDDPDLAKVAATRHYQFPGKGTAVGPGRAHFQIANHNKLLANYPGALGVKNGYTVAARGSFVGAAERDGHRYVVTLLKSEAPTWRHTAALLDWAFANGPQVQPVGSLEPPGFRPADGTSTDGDAGHEGSAAGSPAASGEGADGTAVASRPAMAGLGESWMPLWLKVPLVVVSFLAAAVFLLRVRVLLRRRARAARRLSRS